MNGKISVTLPPAEMKSLAYLFTHEMQNNNHCALDWKSRELMENIICSVIYENYDNNNDIAGWTRRVNALIMTAEIAEYPVLVQEHVKRIRRRIWAHISQARKDYYENN